MSQSMPNIPLDILVHIEEHIGNPMALLDKFNKVLWGNNKLQTLYTQDTLLEKNIIDLVHFFIPDENKLIQFLSGTYQDLELHGPVLSYEIRTGIYIHYKNISSEYKLFWITGSQALGFIKNPLDELSYKRIVHQIFDAIIIYNSDGMIIDANNMVCEMFETDRDHFIGKNIFSLFPHQTLKDANRFWKEFIKTRSLEGIYKYKFENGDFKYLQFKGRADFAGGYHLGVLRDVTSSYLAEKALKKSELQLRTVFNSSIYQIILLDKEYRIITFNKEAFSLVGENWYLNFSIGKSIWDYFPELLKKECDSSYSDFLKGKSLNTHFSMKISEEEKWYDASVVPALDEKGDLKFMSLTLHDVTRVKKTQLALQDSEQKFRRFTENSPDLIYIIDLRTYDTIYFNRDFFIGYETSYLSRILDWDKIIPLDDQNMIKEQWEVFLKNNKFENLEYRIINAKGSIEWVSNRFQILEMGHDGQAVILLATLTVITDKIHAVQALAENQSNLNAVLENTEDLIWSMDEQYRFTTCNTSTKHFFLAYTDYMPQVGKYLGESMDKNFLSEFKLCFRLALDGNKINKEFVFPIKDQDHFYDFRFNPIKGISQEVSGVSIIARNITVRKLNEEELKKMNFELDSFVYRASHDLRAPLRSVLGLINLIDMEENKEIIHKYVGLTEKSIQKLDTFILDLTNFSRNSRLDVAKEKIDFHQLLDEVLDNLQFMDNASQVKIEREVEKDLLFYSDPMRLSIIFQNILSNAYKYANKYSPNSYLHITIKKEGNYLLMQFEDNGIGIKSDHIPQLFTMFFRASQLSYGSGLGLYITRQVVEKLGGEINVESQYNAGTSFFIKLPHK